MLVFDTQPTLKYGTKVFWTVTASNSSLTFDLQFAFCYSPTDVLTDVKLIRSKNKIEDRDAGKPDVAKHLRCW